jgi:glutamate dehydrogenase
VNIKIMLGQLIRAGDMTLKQRNALLVEMTDHVAALVLRDNYLQTAAISLEALQAHSLLPVHGRFMQVLEKTGKLSRRIEYLPSDDQLHERHKAGLGLTSPELAVLLAYAKMVMYEQLLEAPLSASPEWHSLLADYFPPRMRKQFLARIPEHPLKREIVATVLTNECVNRMGISFVFRVGEEASAAPDSVVRAWSLASRLMHTNELWAELEALDNRLDTPHQYALMLEVRKQLERVARWVLRVQMTEAGADSRLTALTHEIPQLLPHLSEWLADHPAYRQRLQQISAGGVPTTLATRVVYLDAMLSLLDITRLSREHAVALEDVAVVYFRLEDALQVAWLRTVIDGLPRENRWHNLARTAMRDELYREHAALTCRVLLGEAAANPQQQVENWLTARQAALAHCSSMFEELQAATPDLAMISAALRELQNRLAA